MPATPSMSLMMWTRIFPPRSPSAICSNVVPYGITRAGSGLYFAGLAPVEQQGYQNYHTEGNGARGFGDVKFLKHGLQHHQEDGPSHGAPVAAASPLDGRTADDDGGDGQEQVGVAHAQRRLRAKCRERHAGKR